MFTFKSMYFIYLSRKSILLLSTFSQLFLLILFVFLLGSVPADLNFSSIWNELFLLPIWFPIHINIKLTINVYMW